MADIRGIYEAKVYIAKLTAELTQARAERDDAREALEKVVKVADKISLADLRHDVVDEVLAVFNEARAAIKAEGE